MKHMETHTFKDYTHVNYQNDKLCDNYHIS